MKEKLMAKGKLTEKRCFLLFFIPLFAFLIFLFSCSSAPRQTGEVFIERDMALSHLNLANQTANRGRYEEALMILEEARRLAVSTDDPSLRIRSSLSRGNFLFFQGRTEEAFLEWESASLEGEASGQSSLAALARIYAIRGRILLLADGADRMPASGPSASEANSTAEELRARLNREIALVRGNDISTAAAYITLGLAERQLGRWGNAEMELRRALDIHQRNNNLEDIAYVWFLIASVRSLAGNHSASLEALRTAIDFDRRVENGFGLASSWQAMGDVYRNAGHFEESRAARRRAAEIFRAIGFVQRAEILEMAL